MMKHLKTPLALLLAGLLLTASLTACDSDTPPADEPADATTTLAEAPPEAPATEPLEPAALLRKIHSADEVLIEIRESEVHEAYSVTYHYTSETICMRDGNAVQYSCVQQGDYDSDTLNRYYDLGEKLCYVEDGRSWTTEPLYQSWSDFEWELRGYIDEEQLLGKKPWKLVDGKYVYTEEGLELRSGMRGYEGELSIEMTAEGNTYTLTETMIGSGDWLSYTNVIKVTFADMTIELPDVPLDELQNDQGEQNEVDESKLLTPSQFFEVLSGDEDMTIVEKWGSDEEETVAVYTRDASKAKRSIDSSDRYYDLAQKREYSYIDDQWLVSELTVFEGWEGLVDFWIWSDDDADPLTVDGNYAKMDGRYVMTEKGIELYFAEQREALDEFDRIYGENPEFEAYFGYENGAHVFGCRLESEDGRFVSLYSVAVTVADMTVELPDA